jgi:tetratricopeptide (TPR) repeat protein
MTRKTRFIIVFIAVITPFIVSLVYHVSQQDKINYNLGHRLFIKGDFKRAIPLYKKSLSFNPEYLLAKEELAYSYLWTDAPEKSIPLFNQILDSGADNNEINLALANAYAWCGDYANAINILKEVIDKTDSLKAKINLAEVYIWSGEALKAKPILENILQISSKDPNIRLQWGKALYYTGESRKASQVFESLIGEKEVAKEASELLAETYLARGQHEKAIDIYEQIIKRENQTLSLKSKINLGDLLSWMGDYEESIARYKMILKSDPDNLEVLKKLADVYKWKGSFKEAQDTYEEALKKYPEDEELYVLIGEVLLWQDKYEKANDYLLRAIESSQREKAGILYARVLLYSGNYLKAQDILKSILEIYPDNVEAQIYLADSYAYSGKYDTAVNLYNQILEKNENNREAKLKLADALSWDKQYQKADKIYYELLMDEYDAKIHRQKARVLGWAHEYDEAEKEYALLIRLNPNNQAYKEEFYAKSAYWSRRPITAIKYYARLIKIEPKNTEAMYDLSQIYAYNLRWQKAFRECEKLLSINPNNIRVLENKKKIERLAENPGFKVGYRHFQADSSSRETDINVNQIDTSIDIPLAQKNHLLINYAFRKRTFSDFPSIKESSPRVSFEHLNKPYWSLMAYYGFVDYHDEIDKVFHFFGANFHHAIRDFGSYIVSYDKDRLVNNSQVIRDGLYAHKFKNRAEFNIGRDSELGIDYLLSSYSDDNILNKPGIDFTYILNYEPKKLTVSYRYDYMQFKDKVPQYWTPKGLSTNSVNVSWRHLLLNEEMAFGKESLYYDLDYDVSVDSNGIVVHKFTGGIYWDIKKELNINLQGLATDSSAGIYRENGLLAELNYYF